MELSKQIKRYRMQRGLSQEDLAGKIYVSRQTVSNWETDKTYPDVQSLLLLSVLFDVTIDELIKGDMEAMKEAVAHDGKKLNALGIVMLVFALAAVVMVVGGISFWDWGIVPSAIIALLLYGVAMAAAIAAERLKKQHDLVTYRELLAFQKGQPVDRDCRSSRRAREHRPLKTALFMLIGASVGACVGYFGFMFLG